MLTSTKILPEHLEKKAVIYVRQSSNHQVVNNLESQKRQYDLQHRAVKLGWPKNRCLTIDEDLGISGARAENRPGYQKLVSMIALKEVGLILGIEVSRLARNCLDWYQLLEIASTFGALIGDEDTIYNPGDFNDRLLLGLKGTISEVELQQIKTRMSRGRINKAKRGELELLTPIGYERDSYTGNISFSKDRSVKEYIDLVFHLFGKIGSVRGTLKELRRRELEMPFWSSEPGLGRKIQWKHPTYEAIYNIIKNPIYAGTYVYGKRKGAYNPITKKYKHRNVDPKDWDIVIPNHHEKYISVSEHEKNLKTLQENSYSLKLSKGAVREGSALLQGIIYCGKCNYKMRARYSDGKAHYSCDRRHNRFGDPLCTYASAQRIDNRVEAMLLEVLNAGTIDLTFQVLKNKQHEDQLEKDHHQKMIERFKYEANLAKRRYESVDPENRLVAGTLEKEWNNCLEKLRDVEEKFKKKFSTTDEKTMSVSKIKEAIRDLPDLWKKDTLSVVDKKEIIRCVVDRVVVNAGEKKFDVRIVWQGGSITALEIPKYLFSDFRVFERISDLAHEHPDKSIAIILNKEKIKTLKGKLWSSRRVMDFRLSNKIPSSFTTSSELRIPDNGYVSSSELSKMLNKASIPTIQRWFRDGILEGHHAGGQCQLWIKVSEKRLHELDGSYSIGPEANTLMKLRSTLNKSTKDAVVWARNNGHKVIRVLRGQRYQFYVIPNNDEALVDRRT